MIEARTAKATRPARSATCRTESPRAALRQICFILVVSSALIAGASAGTISGVVRAQGKPGAEADSGGNGGNYGSRQFKFVERVSYADMHDFVVYVEGPGPAGQKVEPPQKPAQVVTRRVTQRGALFTPHVLPILVGTTVEWPNNDDILHNVFSFSETKSFDLGLYKNPTVRSVTFDKPGRVDVFCSIHTRMNCVILVLENPYFASTNEKGSYTITNVPPGTYKLKAWGERLPSRTREITVPAEGDVKADFTLGLGN
jgi:plastocyanin